MFRVKCPVAGCDSTFENDDFDMLADLVLFHHVIDHDHACEDGDRIGTGWCVDLPMEVKA